VAEQLLAVLTQQHGVLLMQRPLPRLERMKGYGVLVAYLHDIGMIDFSDYGRTMHPEFASQAVFDPALADLVQTIWAQNSGNLPWYLLNLADQGLLAQPPMLVLRELLAMSLCHSKSKVPVAVLNRPEQLRARLIESISTSLPALFHTQRVRKAQARLAELPPGDVRIAARETAVAQATTAYEQFCQSNPDRHNPHLADYYQNPAQEAFPWLVSTHPLLQEFVTDVIDTLRVLRCADALRQRGAVLKTSGSYEIFVNQHTGNAVYALRQRDEQLFLFESPDPVSAGEANIASSELDPAGDLRLSFARGAYSTPAATANAVRCTALVINDIQSDVVESFQGEVVVGETAVDKPANTIRILLEETDDNLDFANQVWQHLIVTYPHTAARVQVVPSLELASLLERELYRTAAVVSWGGAMRREILERIGQSGHRIAKIDAQAAFENVRLATVVDGQVLIEAHSNAAFVYIPLDPGLKVVPLGGYQSFSVQAWMPMGLTGVVRGATRNASVVASRTVRLLMIPKTVYLTHWHHTHDIASLQQLLAGNQQQQEIRANYLTQVEKMFLLQLVPLFADLGEEMLLSLATASEELFFAAGQQLFAAGQMGQSLYVVAEGEVRVHREEQVLARLGRGEFFGEMALLTVEPRMASVTAVSPTTLLRLNRETFNQLVDEHSEIARGVIAALSQRLRAVTQTLTQLDNDS
jgi:CRP-like cAMP-binding protein